LSINFLGLDNENSIGKRLLALSSRKFVREDLDFDTENTLTKEDVASCLVNEITDLTLATVRIGEYRLARVNHETVGKFHGFGTSSTKFSRDDDFTTLSTRFHNESKDTITSTESAHVV
jgi:hypothetical protein